MNLFPKISLLSLSTAAAIAVAGAPAAAAAPPETTVTGGPAEGSIITDSAPSFTFESTAADATFACRIADQFGSVQPPFAPCGTPFTADPPLADGRYQFDVYSSSLLEGEDPTPATVNFTVDGSGGPDLTPPSTTITDGPAEGSTITTATPMFSFAAAPDASKVSFLCSIDSGAMKTCHSPFTTSSLADGQHTFAVRGVDQAGNLEDVAHTRTFTVAVPPPPPPAGSGGSADGQPADTTGPTTSIDKAPKKRATRSKARITFSANERATFECSLTGKNVKPRLRRFAACHSPMRYAHLKAGRYSFRVRGTDLAGNVGNTTSYSWKVRKNHG
jgi:hypothetical protein